MYVSQGQIEIEAQTDETRHKQLGNKLPLMVKVFLSVALLEK